MTAPTPGPAWQELDPNAPVPEGAEILDWYPVPDGTAQGRRWVYTPPAPLPTAPGTVIRVDAGRAAGTWTLGSMGWSVPGDSAAVRGEDLAPQVDAYTVTAAPPAVTAAAVLTDVRAAFPTNEDALAHIAEHYGATLTPPADA